MPTITGLDFETYCELNLKEVGLMRYVNHPTFTITLAAIDSPYDSHVLQFPARTPVSFRALLSGADIICAHNAGFERAVLRTMGLDLPIIDSAVVASVAGADRSLFGAARQLLCEDKLDEDGSLINLFAKPQKGQADPEFDMSLLDNFPSLWQKYKDYCARDARLSRRLVEEWRGDPELFEREMRYAQITLNMNEAGWPVDIRAVGRMRQLYLENLERIESDFAAHVDADLNLNSHVQLKKWCADRGIRSTSFDKQHVERLIARLNNRAASHGLTPGQTQVLDMLKTKQALGGSSLKKLDTILNTAYDGRLYDQYVHAGAPQTLRTSGRSAQMQNLPKLPKNPADMDSLFNGSVWSNDELGDNLRQVFTSSHPQGELLVADFASIESRMLAYLASETWKTEAYRRGEDVYKAQAMKIYNLSDITSVTTEQRTTGKVGELSCGYGAGPVAVKDFAAKMHVEFTDGEAGKLVNDWREANPETVAFWAALDSALHTLLQTGHPQWVIAGHGVKIWFAFSTTPDTLLEQDGQAQSVRMDVLKSDKLLLSRVFHGCYMRGRDVSYYKPESNKGGKPWKKTYVDPKTKRRVYYKLYGGKLTGILTQSMCREIFFESLECLDRTLAHVDNATIVGQFHDEVIIDWVPGSFSKEYVMGVMETAMCHSPTHPGLPMAVEVKSAYRYIK